MPENKSPRGEECSCVVLGGNVGDDGILDVNVAALRLRFRAERMLFVLEAPGEKASTKTMLVLQMDIAATTLSITPSAIYSVAIWSGDRAMVGLGFGCCTGSISSEGRRGEWRQRTCCHAA